MSHKDKIWLQYYSTVRRWSKYKYFSCYHDMYDVIYLTWQTLHRPQIFTVSLTSVCVSLLHYMWQPVGSLHVGSSPVHSLANGVNGASFQFTIRQMSPRVQVSPQHSESTLLCPPVLSEGILTINRHTAANMWNFDRSLHTFTCRSQILTLQTLNWWNSL